VEEKKQGCSACSTHSDKRALLSDEPKRDARGFYRCPFKCGDPQYPQPKWKTLKGYEKHIVSCSFKPPPIHVPTPQPAPELFGNCTGCGSIVLHGDTIWISRDVWRCYDCALFSSVLPRPGYLDCAGLVLAGFEDIVA
jgi:hypothetical protein